MNLTTICLLAVLAAAMPQGAGKPNFSGTWRANFAKSKLQIQQPESTVFTLDHREPVFILSRTHTFAGKSDTWGIELTTDGKEIVKREAGRTIRARLAWEGHSLVFDVKLDLPEGKGHDKVKYSLSRDGKTFTAHESYRDPQHAYDNVWVFDRVK